MLTSAECRAQAEGKLAQAQRNDRNRKRLINAAEAWLYSRWSTETSRAGFST